MNALEVVFVLLRHVSHAIVWFQESFRAQFAVEGLACCVRSFQVLFERKLCRLAIADSASVEIAVNFDELCLEVFKCVTASIGLIGSDDC